VERGFPRWSHLAAEVYLLKQQSTPCNNDAMSAKTPASLLSGIYAAYLSSLRLKMIGTTVIGLLISQVWHRTLARIQRMYSGGASPETSTTRPSPATRLPQEIVEMIIAYLIYDKRSLCACTSTCYSWHIAAIPHLHHTLTIDTYCPQVFWWADRLLFMHMLGLLPLVKMFRIHGQEYADCVGVSPKLFNCCILLQFYALTNVRELEIQFLDIPKFLPRNLWYSRHFLPNIQSLALREPRGTGRQIVCFIGLFQHLQDLKLIYDGNRVWGREPTDDLTLMPPFAPPLGGHLTIKRYRGRGILEKMINLFGGIRFRHMDLYYVRRMRLLLDACAETLESVVLTPSNIFDSE